MNNDLMVQNDDVPAIADDFLLSIADNAEKRIDAVIKIKNIALKVTNARDWTDQQGNPYLQVSGSEKIANLFNISWRIEEPRCEEEPDGHFTYSIKGVFSLGGRTIEVEGTRSSKDPFFNRYDYSQPKDPVTGKHPVLPPSSIDKGDVKKAALTNLFGNGITRMLGIRNLTWDDLQKYAGITQEMIKQKVSYNQRESGGDRPPIQKPQEKKTEQKPSGEDITEKQRGRFYAIAKSTGASDDDVKAWMKKNFGIESSKEIKKDFYEDICERVLELASPEPGSEG